MNCPNCNAAVEPFDRFCENCGCVLSHAPSAAPAQPYAASPDAAQGYVAAGTREPFVDPMAEDAAADAAPDAPDSPYETAEHIGQHAAPAQRETYVPTAAAVATAFAESAAATAAYIREDASTKGDPYAAAVKEAANPTSAAQPAQPASFQSGTPYAQPVYAQPSYQPSQPEAPYYDYRGDTPIGAPQASAAGLVLAIISLVFGCIGLLTFGLFGFLGVIGIILGIIALALRSGYAKRGEYDAHAGSTFGVGIAGIITNIIAFVIFMALVVFVAIAADASDSYEYDFDSTPAIEELVGQDA